MLRHRTLEEIAQDCIDRIADVTGVRTCRAVCATEFGQIVEAVEYVETFPAVLVVPTGGGYDGRGAWKRRDDRVNILCVGEWSADVAGADTAVWDLVEDAARCFLPGGDLDDATPADSHSSQHVEIHGVVYAPMSLRPVAVGKDRTAVNLLLAAVNPMQTFDD